MIRSAAHTLAASILLAAAASFAAGPSQTTPREAWVERAAGTPTIVFVPQRSVPMFSCTVLVPAGSALETPASNGAAHFLEHLLFNGTTSRDREQIYARGDLLGAYNNASTQRERTVFQLLLPSEHWREGLELQADMLLHSTLPLTAFDKEKGIILEELAKDQSDPAAASLQWEESALWGNDPRALPVLGTKESIAAMERDTVGAFYRERYQAAGMTLVVMGDFDADEARAEILRHYGTSDAPASLPGRPMFPQGRKLLAHPGPDLELTRLRVVLPLPALAGGDHAGARLLAGWLTSGEKSALHHAVEATGTSALDVSAAIDAGHPWSALIISVALPTEATADEAAGIVDAVLAHLAALEAIGVDGTDRASVRRQLLLEELSLREKMHYYGLMRADVLGTDPEAALRITDELAAAEEAAFRLLRAGLTDGRVFATIVGKNIDETRRSIPVRPATADASWITKSTASGVPPLPPRPPVTGTTETLRVVLENGVVVVAHASPDSRTFAAHVLLKNRARRETAAGLPRGASDVLHRMMGYATERLDTHELRGLLSNFGASLKVTDASGIPYDDYYFTPEYSYLRLESFDLFGFVALEILGEVLAKPAFTAENLAQARDAAMARAEQDAHSPRFVAGALQAGASDLAGAVYGAPDDLRALDLESLRRLHRSLIDPRNVLVTISSNLPADAVIEAARRSFGALRQDEAVLPPSPAPPMAAAGHRSETNTGRDQSWIVVGRPLDVVRADEPSLRLATAILSERLAERLREREGLAYSIGASVRIAQPGASVVMEAGTRAQNLEVMERGMLEVAASLRSDPPTADEVEGARNRNEGRDRMRRLSRMGIAYALAVAELRGRDPLALDADVPVLRAVTPEDVLHAASRYLAFESPWVSIAR